MALGFGRKKTDDVDAASTDATASQRSAPIQPFSPADSVDDSEEDSGGSLDLDDFATQLEGGLTASKASPFDDLTASSAARAGSSAYDFPEDGPAKSASNEPESLDLNEMFAAEQRSAIASGLIQPPAQPTIPAPAAPAVEALPPSVKAEAEAPAGKKKLPLIPIGGGLALLVVIGVAAALMKGGGDSSDDSDPLPVAPSIRAGVASKIPAPAPPAPGTAPVAPSEPAVAPATTALSPATATQLKVLWKQGADAKHRKDYTAAVRFWQQGLKLQPGNKGFEDSIAKVRQ